MGWFSQPILEEGIQQGRIETRATLLERLIERRFGQLSADLRARVFAANIQSLDAWFDRAIDATDLPSVFTESPGVHQ